MVIATRLNDGQRDIFDNTEANKSKTKFKIDFNTIKSSIRLLDNQEWFLKVFKIMLK